MFIIICFLVLIILLITKTIKYILSATFILMATGYFIAICTFLSCNSDDSTRSTSDNNIYGTEQQSAAYLSSSDSEEIKNELKSFNGRIDRIYNTAQKAHKQYTRYAAMFANGEVSDYEFYEVVKDAKSVMESSESAFSNIDVGTKLTGSLKNTLNGAISDLTTYYSTMISAYNVVIDVLNNKGSDMSNIDDYKQKVGLANELYSQGQMELLDVEISMGMMQPKHKKKANKISDY